MKTLILLLSSLVFSSCMHMGMMGHGDHASASHSAATESVLEKEVILDNVKAVATFPPLQTDKDVVMRLRLVDARTLQPVPGAKVYFHAQYAHVATQNSSHDHSGATSGGPPERDHDVNIDQDVRESTPGVYSIPYGSSQPGEHTLMFHIAAIGDRKFDPEFVIEAKRTLAASSHEQGGGMMGMSSTTTYVVIGAVVMGAMMALMLAR
ncbi:MAG: hypothetical protein HY961_14545 [Ignavibacteriae bacterium]|nr:hypothetical protein [Ignavibacteriota bacterium]